jgi:hypothetical protein
VAHALEFFLGLTGHSLNREFKDQELKGAGGVFQ